MAETKQADPYRLSILRSLDLCTARLGEAKAEVATLKARIALLDAEEALDVAWKAYMTSSTKSARLAQARAELRRAEAEAAVDKAEKAEALARRRAERAIDRFHEGLAARQSPAHGGTSGADQ